MTDATPQPETPSVYAVDMEIKSDPSMQPSAKLARYRRLAKDFERDIGELKKQLAAVSETAAPTFHQAWGYAAERKDEHAYDKAAFQHVQAWIERALKNAAPQALREGAGSTPGATPDPVAKPAGAASLAQALDSAEFYELSQAYRHTPLSRQADVQKAWDAMKQFILDHAARPEANALELGAAVRRAGMAGP